jgi:hypothetical protein
MISRIDSVQSTQATTRALQAEAKPAAARPQPAKSSETAARAAVVVRIGGDARALASQEDSEARAQVGEQSGERAPAASESRSEIEIQPVVAQPVPDFKAAGAAYRQAASSTVARSSQAEANEPRPAAAYTQSSSEPSSESATASSTSRLQVVA